MSLKVVTINVTCHVALVYLVRVFQFWWWHISDTSHGLKWWLVEKRGFSVYHLYHHYTQRPNINLFGEF